MSYEEHSVHKRYSALLAAFAAVIGIPFYLGVTHLPVAQLFLYSGVASTAMATGQFVDTPKGIRGGAKLFISELGLWFALVLVGGGLAYVVALIF